MVVGNKQVRRSHTVAPFATCRCLCCACCSRLPLPTLLLMDLRLTCVLVRVMLCVPPQELEGRLEKTIFMYVILAGSPLSWTFRVTARARHGYESIHVS